MAKAKRTRVQFALVPAKIQQVQELRRSGAAGSHGDKRLARQKTRQAVKTTALRDW